MLTLSNLFVVKRKTRNVSFIAKYKFVFLSVLVMLVMMMLKIMMMMMEVGRSNLESGGMIFANPRVSQNHALPCQMSNLTEVVFN